MWENFVGILSCYNPATKPNNLTINYVNIEETKNLTINYTKRERGERERERERE